MLGIRVSGIGGTHGALPRGQSFSAQQGAGEGRGSAQTLDPRYALRRRGSTSINADRMNAQPSSRPCPLDREKRPDYTCYEMLGPAPDGFRAVRG
jgi:hypothetical protein